MRLDDSEEPLVSGTIIDSSKIASSDTKSVPAEYTPDTTGAKIQIIKAGSGETEVSIDKGLVIAGEDVNVKVEKNFTGLILSAGKVTIPQNMNLNMKADSVLIKQIMEYIKSDSYLSSLFPALSGTLTNNPTDTTECVSYSNWVKNS
jgi:activator of HSP90 ATPase